LGQGAAAAVAFLDDVTVPEELVAEHAGGKGFDHVLDDAEVDRASDRVDVACGADGDHVDVPARGADGTTHLEAPDVREPEVEEQQVDRFLGDGFQRPATGADGGHDGEAFQVVDDRPMAATDDWLVLDDEHPDHGPTSSVLPER
jgi:hypothetical protein